MTLLPGVAHNHLTPTRKQLIMRTASKGLTTLECLIAAAVVAIMTAVVLSSLYNEGGTRSFGINGMTEFRCIDGQRFIVGHSGHVAQVLDANGKPVVCQR